MFDEDIYLTIGGTRFTGWLRAVIDRSVESLCGSFSFDISMKKTPNNLLMVKMGTPAVVSIGQDTVINGYIDEPIVNITDTGAAVTITGRDKTQDLVDCSSNVNPFSWNNITLVQLANILCKPFNITVVKVGDWIDSKNNYKLNTGETPFDLLSKGAASQGILLLTNSEGNLVLASISDTLANDPLIFGKNVKNINGGSSIKERYHKYIVKSQKDSDGGGWTEATLNVHAEAIDETIRNTRTLIIKAEQGSTIKQAQARATWEATIRAANSSKLSVRVINFRQTNNVLWKENTLVNANIKAYGLEIEERLLISGITYTYDDTGRYADLVLKRKEAYAPSPKNIVSKKQTATWLE